MITPLKIPPGWPDNFPDSRRDVLTAHPILGWVADPFLNPDFFEGDRSILDLVRFIDENRGRRGSA